MRAWTIYTIGVIALGLAYALLKESLHGPVVLCGAILYLALLRWFALRYGRK